jgi:hypothetical protein
MKKKKPAMSLPRLNVFYHAHHLEKREDGAHWVGQNIDVEVVSLHFNTGSMRVRSVEKIPHYDGDIPAVRSFDMSCDEFFKYYKLVPMV